MNKTKSESKKYDLYNKSIADHLDRRVQAKQNLEDNVRERADLFQELSAAIISNNKAEATAIKERIKAIDDSKETLAFEYEVLSAMDVDKVTGHLKKEALDEQLDLMQREKEKFRMIEMKIADTYDELLYLVQQAGKIRDHSISIQNRIGDIQGQLTHVPCCGSQIITELGRERGSIFLPPKTISNIFLGREKLADREEK